MVGPFTTIFSREESLPTQAICATYRARPARAHWGTPEVLPALQSILLEEFKPSEPVEKGIAQFISARQLINRPVTISVFERDGGP